MPGIEEEATQIILSNDYAVYKISKAAGRSAALTINATGGNLVATPRPFASYMDSSRNHQSNSILYHRISDTEAELTVAFPTGVNMTVRCKAANTHFVFELIDVQPATGITRTSIAALRLTGEDYNQKIGAVYKGNFVVSASALRVETEIYCAPVTNQAGIFLAEARSHQEINLLGSKVALILCPTSQWLTLVEGLELDYGLPHPTIDGIWAKKHPDVKSSYLFVDITPANVDAIIDYAIQGRFKYILAYVTTWAEKIGSYEINTDNYPAGLVDLQTVVNKVHAKRLKFGFHTLSCLIDKTDRYVTPVPDPRLAKESPMALAANLDATTLTDLFIPVSATTPLDDYAGYFKAGKKDIIIDGEIFRAARVETSSGHGIVAERRGRYGTTRTTHAAGATIYHLPEESGRFVPDLNSSLLPEIAQNFAQTYNAAAGDFLYLDGIAGVSEAFRPAYQKYYWHTTAIVAANFFNAITRDVLIESAGGQPVNFQWHIDTRGVSADFAFIGVEPYMDGVKIGWFTPRYKTGFFHQELGWIGMLAKVGRPRDDSFASTTLDEIEYQMNRALSYGFPIGLETHYDDLRANGSTEEILALIARYEELRWSNYFPRAVLVLLQEPDQAFIDLHHLKKADYQLVQNAYGVYGFKRRAYAEHYVAEATNDNWSFANPFAEQPLQIKITALPTCADYDDADNKILTSAADISQLIVDRGTQDFITPDLQNVGGKLKITVTNSSTGETGWLRITKLLPAAPVNMQDLSDHKAIGVEVTGDAGGEVVSIQLTDSRSLDFNRQYQFVIDFTGTQYKELAIPATTELFKYPYETGFPFSLKRSLRDFSYREVKEFAILIKNIQPGQTASIFLGPVKALRQEQFQINHPSLTIGDRPITFPTTLQPQHIEVIDGASFRYEPWEYLVFDGANYKKYDGNNQLIETGAPLGETPIVAAGNNAITYQSITSADEDGRNALVTILMEDTPMFHGDYFIWCNPLDFLSLGDHLSIEKGRSGHSIRIRTNRSGDLQWIALGLTLPSNIKIKQIAIHYKLSHSRSFISQVRLTETTTPGTAVVKHDDGADLTSTTAAVYHSQ